MDYFPIFMTLHGAPVSVAGGGDVALRKVRLLLAAGAAVRVIAPTCHPELLEMATAGTLTYTPRTWVAGDETGCRVVIAATDDAAVNQAVSAACQAVNIPVNVVDNPALCSFIMPSIVDRSPVLIAISSSGGMPVLARWLRTQIEALLPTGLARLARFGHEARARTKAAIPDANSRRGLWERLLASAWAERMMNGDEAQARAEFDAALAAHDAPTVGAVYLVGGGPGNPDLLTFRALRLMQQADVVLYDNLVAPEIVELTRRDADRIYVGKRTNQHALPQEEINLLLVKLAKEGKRVVRLKGGDPFMFGRGGEEIATLAAQGVPFEVVPGITSACGAAAYAGIPLTHRDYAQSCVFVTGHRQDGSIQLDWDALARPHQTVVIYMGVATAEALCAALIAHGKPADTPAAVVERATTPQQRVFTGTLTTLPSLMQTHAVGSPALIIVGEVVQLAPALTWYAPPTHKKPRNRCPRRLAACYNQQPRHALSPVPRYETSRQHGGTISDLA